MRMTFCEENDGRKGDRDDGDIEVKCLSQDEQVSFWENKGFAIHYIENNIDLTDYTMGGKPTQFFNLLTLFPLTSDNFAKPKGGGPGNGQEEAKGGGQGPGAGSGEESKGGGQRGSTSSGEEAKGGTGSGGRGLAVADEIEVLLPVYERKILLQASQNEVVLNDDWLGLNQKEVIDNKYLTLEVPDITTSQP